MLYGHYVCTLFNSYFKPWECTNYLGVAKNVHCSLSIVIESGFVKGSLQSLEWNGGLEWWNGMVELLIQQK